MHVAKEFIIKLLDVGATDGLRKASHGTAEHYAANGLNNILVQVPCGICTLFNSHARICCGISRGRNLALLNKFADELGMILVNLA